MAAAAMLAVVASPAVARSVAIGFAPPIGQALVYRIDQQRPVDGHAGHFTSTRRLRFDRAVDGGYILHVTLDAIDSDAPAASAEPYRAAMTPLIGVEHLFHVGATGKIVALDNMDAVWTAAQAGFARMVHELGVDTPRGRVAQNVLTLFAGLPTEGRLALLAGEVQPLLLFADGRVEDGAGRGVRTTAGAPLGRPVPVEGSVALIGQAADRLTLEEKLAGAGVTATTRYIVSSATGLVEEQTRALTSDGRSLEEKRRLALAK